MTALLWFSLITWEKAPFDLVEAESELIDGATTEFDGYVFSSIYAGEIAVSLITLKLFSTFAGFVLLPLLAVIVLTFVGRIFLARFLIADVIEFCLSVGL